MENICLLQNCYYFFMFISNYYIMFLCYVALSCNFIIIFIYVSPMYANVVICRQELFCIRDLLVRARFVYGCTCKCMECCSNLIGQTNQINLTMQHDNG